MPASKKLRSYPYFVGMISVISLAALLQVFAIVNFFFPLISYETDAVSTDMFTCAEVPPSVSQVDSFALPLF